MFIQCKLMMITRLTVRVLISIIVVIVFLLFVTFIIHSFNTHKNTNLFEHFTYLQHAISGIGSPTDIGTSRIEIIPPACVNNPKECIIDHRMNNRQPLWNVPNTKLDDQNISESTLECIADPLACFQKEKEALKTSVEWDTYDQNKDEILQNIHDYYQAYFKETEHLSREERLEQMFERWTFKQNTVMENSTVKAFPPIIHSIQTHFSNLGYIVTQKKNPSELYVATTLSDTGRTEYLNINHETNQVILNPIHNIINEEQSIKSNEKQNNVQEETSDDKQIILHEITLSSPNLSFFELMLLMDSLYTATGKYKVVYPIGEDSFTEMKPILENAIAMYRTNVQQKKPLIVSKSIFHKDYEFITIDKDWIQKTLSTFT